MRLLKRLLAFLRLNWWQFPLSVACLVIVTRGVSRGMHWSIVYFCGALLGFGAGRIWRTWKRFNLERNVRGEE